jgi:hypothetical protein
MFDIAKRAAVVIVAAVIIHGIAEAQVQAPVPDAYAFLYSRTVDVEAARKRLPFTSISIEHRGCFGTCPVYTATLNLDGSAIYEGKRNVERIGRFLGRVAIRDFAQLCLLIERSDFTKFGDRLAQSSDDETVIVLVSRRNGESTRVVNYAMIAPPEAWVVQRAIAGVVARLQWRPATTGR